MLGFILGLIIGGIMATFFLACMIAADDEWRTKK